VASASLIRASTREHFELARELIDEYALRDSEQTSALGFDGKALLEFHYGDDVATLTWKYAAPAGCLLLAKDGDNAAGCGGFHELAPGICEMKRIYVRPAFRGRGIARNIVATLIQEAQQVGYAAIRLETTTFMQDAQKLYAAHGFLHREPYYELPEMFRPITVFMELRL
jgi:putative acetyltransferase